MNYSTILETTASIHTILIGFLLILESINKRALLESQDNRGLSREETVGLFEKRFYWYLNSLFQEGYRKILKVTDLIDLDTDLASKRRDTLFQDVWTKQDKSSGKPLLRTIMRVLWADLLLPVMPRYDV
jgi:ATP-binding cassette subfamily C (CFTR/MRP) protein 1